MLYDIFGKIPMRLQGQIIRVLSEKSQFNGRLYNQ